MAWSAFTALMIVVIAIGGGAASTCAAQTQPPINDMGTILLSISVGSGQNGPITQVKIAAPNAAASIQSVNGVTVTSSDQSCYGLLSVQGSLSCVQLYTKSSVDKAFQDEDSKLNGNMADLRKAVQDSLAAPAPGTMGDYKRELDDLRVEVRALRAQVAQLQRNRR